MKPRFEYGERVRVVRTLRNDGTFPGMETGDVLTLAGRRGRAERGHVPARPDHLRSAFHRGRPDGRLPRGGADPRPGPLGPDPVPVPGPGRQSDPPTVGGMVVVPAGEPGEVLKVLRDAPAGPAYHVYFDGRVFQVPETALEPVEVPAETLIASGGRGTAPGRRINEEDLVRRRRPYRLRATPVRPADRLWRTLGRRPAAAQGGDGPGHAGRRTRRPGRTGAGVGGRRQDHHRPRRRPRDARPEPAGPRLGSRAGGSPARSNSPCRCAMSRFVTVEVIDHEPDEAEADARSPRRDHPQLPGRFRAPAPPEPGMRHRAGIPFLDAAQWGMAGSLLVSDGRTTPCLACALPDVPPFESHFPVVGAIAATMGSLAVLEAIKIVSGTGQPMWGEMLVIDGFRGEMRQIRLTRRPDCSRRRRRPTGHRGEDQQLVILHQDPSGHDRRRSRGARRRPPARPGG